jgi:hypothetical protein
VVCEGLNVGAGARSCERCCSLRAYNIKNSILKGSQHHGICKGI